MSDKGYEETVREWGRNMELYRKWEEYRGLTDGMSEKEIDSEFETRAMQDLVYSGGGKEPRSPIGRFLNRDKTKKAVVLNAVDGGKPQYISSSPVICGDGYKNCTNHQILEEYEEDKYLGYDECYWIPDVNISLFTKYRFIWIGSIREGSWKGDYYVVSILFLNEVEEIFFRQKEYPYERNSTDSFGSLQLHSANAVFHFDTDMHAFHLGKHIADIANLGDSYKVEGPVNPDEYTQQGEPEWRFDLGWGKEERDWEKEREKVEVRHPRQEPQQTNNQKAIEKPLNKEAIEDSLKAHNEATKRKPPVDIGDEVRFGIIEFRPHHSGESHALGKVEGFVIFARDVPDFVEENQVIRAKVVHYNENRQSATAKYIGLDKK